MLATDPIISKFPELLPTKEEVARTRQLLQQAQYADIFQALCDTVTIGRDIDASLGRMCWQAHEDGKFGDDCPQTAVHFIETCLEARVRLGMDSILASTCFTPAFRSLYFSTCPFTFHGVDRQGHPIFIIRYRGDVQSFQRLWALGRAIQEVNDFSQNAVVVFHLRGMEYLTKIAMAFESVRQGRTVDRVLTIMDLGTLSMRHIDAPLKAFYASVARESIKLFPEVMHATVIVNVPWIFERALWPLARRFLSPVTQEKFVFASAGNIKNALLDRVSSGTLPSYFGGSCRCAECVSGDLHGGSMARWEARQHGIELPSRSASTERARVETRKTTRGATVQRDWRSYFCCCCVGCSEAGLFKRKAASKDPPSLTGARTQAIPGVSRACSSGGQFDGATRASAILSDTRPERSTPRGRTDTFDMDIYDGSSYDVRQTAVTLALEVLALGVTLLVVAWTTFSADRNPV